MLSERVKRILSEVFVDFCMWNGVKFVVTLTAETMGYAKLYMSRSRLTYTTNM
jgi:hypothetical protein